MFLNVFYVTILANQKQERFRHKSSEFFQVIWLLTLNQNENRRIKNVKKLY